MKKIYLVKTKLYSKKLYKNEHKRLMLRAIFSELRLFGVIRFSVYLKLSSNNLGSTKIMYSCFDSAQTRGVVKFFNVYRMIFRENASFAKYVGIKKASW